MKRYPTICFGIFAFAFAICCAQQNSSERKPLSPQNWSKLREGDIVFIRSRSDNAPLIAELSNINAKDDADTVFTHCGIVFKDANDGKMKVYEGAGRGTHLTLKEWRERESKGKVNGRETSEPLHNVYVRRWSGRPDLATGLEKVLERAKGLHDTTYDNGFCWSDSHAYCSELVWKAFEAGGFALGRLPTMEHYVSGASKAIAQKIKAKLEAEKKEYRDDKGYLPDEPAVSPEDILVSSALVSVTDDSP
jgi:permuted papain-like amidase YaeF/Yiix C92 family enzyme